jgi:hypothetical protein
MTRDGWSFQKEMPGQNERTHAETDGLREDEIDEKPAPKIERCEEQGNNGIEHACQGEAGEDPLFVQWELHKLVLYYPDWDG